MVSGWRDACVLLVGGALRVRGEGVDLDSCLVSSEMVVTADVPLWILSLSHALFLWSYQTGLFYKSRDMLPVFLSRSRMVRGPAFR